MDIRYFLYQQTKYVWIAEAQVFATVDNLVPALNLDDYLNNLDGLNEEEYTNR